VSSARAAGCLLAAVAGVAWGAPARADLAEVEQRGTLRVVVSIDELPHMFSFEEGGHPGLEREMVEAFARSRGLRVEIVPVERFEDVIPTLLEGRGDLVTGIINTAARRERIAFTVETLPARHVAVTRDPSPPVGTLADLRSRRVGTVAGSSWTDAALEAGVPEENLVQSEGAQRVLQDLREGTVDAVVMSVTDFAQAQREDGMLQAGILVGSAASAGWGVRKEDRELRRALDEFLGSLLRSPSWNQMVLKYFNKAALDLIARGRQ
jgi:ABC-type amino acid transport substrate-binding protein